MTFNTAPTYDPTAVASVVLADSIPGFRHWDITALVSGWVTGEFANYGFWIEQVPIGGSGSAYFSAADHAEEYTRPTLLIDYSVPVPEPGTVALLAMGMLGVAVRVRSRARARARARARMASLS